MRSLVVLAGGRSTRFGAHDKALLRLGDHAMTRHVVDRLTDVVDEVVVNCRASQEPALRDAFADAPYRVVFAVDDAEDLGPVGGIQAGMEAASGEYAAVVACDMPFVDPAFVDYLFSRADGHDGALPRPDEYFEVTQAVYHATTMAAACAEALAAEESKVLAPIGRMDVVVVDGREVATHAAPRTFENVNTPAAFRAAAEALGVDPDDRVLGDEARTDDAVDAP